MTIAMTRPQTGGNARSANQRAVLRAIDQWGDRKCTLTQHQRDWDLCLHSSVVSNISSTLAPHFRDEQKVCHHNFLFISAVIIYDHWFKIIKVLGPPCHYSYLISPGHDATEGGGDPLVAAVVNGLTGPGKLLDSLPATAVQLKIKYNVISSGSCSPYLSLNDILALLINLLPAQMQNVSNL